MPALWAEATRSRTWREAPDERSALRTEAKREGRERRDSREGRLTEVERGLPCLDEVREEESETAVKALGTRPEQAISELPV